MLSMWRAFAVALLFVFLAGQAETIPISNDNQVKKQDINAPLGDTYDDEIANRVARDVLSKATKEGWPLSSSVRDCYNQARQQETDILYCITLDILNYKFSHGSIEYAELQSVIERADATLSALGRQNETAFAVTHAMRISNRVRDILDTTVELESQPEPPPATPPEAAVPHTPSATASAPPAGNAPPPSPTTTASNPPEAPAPAETPSATASAPPAAEARQLSPTTTASNPPEAPAPPETPAPSATAPAPPAVNTPPLSPTTTAPAPPAVNAPPPSPTATASNAPEAPAPPETPPLSATAPAPPAVNAPPASAFGDRLGPAGGQRSAAFA